MFSKLGLIGGMFAAATTLSLASVVEADTKIDAWTFLNDGDFCGDDEHIVPAGEVLTIHGGSGTHSGDCHVYLGEGSTFEIVGGAVLDINDFELTDESAPGSGVFGNNVTVRIKKSKIFGIGAAINVELSRGVNNKISCEKSYLAATDDLNLGVGSDGVVKLDRCELMNVDGGLLISAAYSGLGQTGGEIEIDESIFTMTNGTRIWAGMSDNPDGDIEIKDSIFMEAWRIWIQSSGKLRAEDNIFAGVSIGLVVNADDCMSEDDFVVGTGPTDICP